MKLAFKNKSYFYLVIVMTIILLLNNCKEENAPIDSIPIGPEARLAFGKFVKDIIHPDPLKCDKIILAERPYYIGDSIAIIISQEFGAQIIGTSDVFVTITSKLKDSEKYLLSGKPSPCEIWLVDYAIYKSMINYNKQAVDKPTPNNGQLEIRLTGDTLLASFRSFSTGKILYDSLAIIPN
jgi:hypothetical protein